MESIHDPENRFLCEHHDQEFELFCEECQDPACRLCAIDGPHNNELHTVISIAEASDTRIDSLHKLIGTRVVEKRKEAIDEIKRLKEVATEVSRISKVISDDIEHEISKAFASLESSERNLSSQLNSQIFTAQNQMAAIDDCLEVYSALDRRGSEVDFLLVYKELSLKVRNLVAKPLISTIYTNFKTKSIQIQSFYPES